jgi:hypothetical protein
MDSIEIKIAAFTGLRQQIVVRITYPIAQRLDFALEAVLMLACDRTNWGNIRAADEPLLL